MAGRLRHNCGQICTSAGQRPPSAGVPAQLPASGSSAKTGRMGRPESPEPWVFPAFFAHVPAAPPTRHNHCVEAAKVLAPGRNRPLRRFGSARAELLRKLTNLNKINHFRQFAFTDH